MMHMVFYIFLSVAMGVMLAVYLPMNNSVAKHLDSPITANITFFFVALVSSIAIFLLWGEFSTLKKIKDVPLWLFATGIASAFMILGTTFLMPKVGARQLYLLTITGQILMAMIISHFGLLDTPKDLVTVNKVLGAGLILAGAVLSIL